MTTKRLLITNLLMYLILVLSVYFLQNLVFVDASDPIRSFTINEYIPIFVGLVVLIFVFFYIEKKRNNLKTNWLLLFVLIALFVCNTIAVLSVPNSFSFTLINPSDGLSYDGTYTAVANSKVYYILSGAIALFVTYLLLAVAPRRFRYKKHIDIVFYCALAVILGLMIYSYVTEFDNYVGFVVQLFTNNPDVDAYANTVKSLFPYRTNYGLVLFLGLFCTLFLHHHNNKWWYFLVYGFIYLNLVFTLCKTALICGVILILGYLLARFFLSYKQHKKMNIITISIFGGLFVIGGLLVLTSFIIPTGILATIRDAVIELFVEGGSRTVGTRVWIWDNVIAILNNGFWAFGTGLNNLHALTLAYNGTNLPPPDNTAPGPHSGYLLILGQSGIVGIVIFGLALAYLVYIMVRIYKNNKTLVWLETIFMVSLLLYMFTEPVTPILSSSAENIFICFVVYTPVLARYCAEKCPLESEEIARSVPEVSTYKFKLDYKKFAAAKFVAFIYAPFVGAFASFATFIYPNNRSLGQLLAVIAIGLFAGLVILPYLVQVVVNLIQHAHKSKYSLPKYAMEVFIPSLIAFSLCVVFSAVLFFFLNPATYSTSISLTESQVITTIVLITVMLVFSYSAIMLAVPGLRHTFTIFSVPILRWLNNKLTIFIGKSIRKDNSIAHTQIALSEAEKAKKKILLIMPDFFYFADAIEGEMIKEGYYVKRYDDRPSKKTMSKSLIRINRKMMYQQTYSYVDRINYDTLDISFDYVVVILGQAFTKNMMQQIKDKQPNAKFIYYLWDTVKNMPYSLKLAEIFDVRYCFEPKDALDNPEFTFKTNFYTNEFAELKKDRNPEYDIFYVGTAYPRKIGEWDQMKKSLEGVYPSRYLHFYLPSSVMYSYFKVTSRNYHLIKKSDVSFEAVSKNEILDLLSKSKYVLDLPRDNQGGLTMRIFECLASEHKIITTNKEIMNYDFYNPKNIYIYSGGPFDLSSDFFTKGYEKVKPEILKQYSIDNFVKTLLQ